jgi:hypothetical protein
MSSTYDDDAAKYPSGEFPGFARDSDTSHGAAESVVESAKALRRRIYGLLRDADPKGFTCEEMEIFLDRSHQTVSPRFTDLKREKLIYDTGLRRATTSGRPATVYRCTRPFRLL